MIMKTNMSIKVGKNLKQARLDKGLTQKEIASEFHFTQQQYSRFETGLFELNYEQVDKICKLLDITPNELYGYDF